MEIEGDATMQQRTGPIIMTGRYTMVRVLVGKGGLQNPELINEIIKHAPGDVVLVFQRPPQPSEKIENRK